ncbi:MAG: hypothetical protein ABJB11_14220 [Ferruginibacter sp.]
MKKIFTLVLLAAGTISFANAQTHNQKNNTDKYSNNQTKSQRDDDAHQSGYDNNHSTGYATATFTYKEKEAQLSKINRLFNQQIVDVKHNRRLNSWEKSKQIRLLEKQRSEAISQVEYRFAKSNHRDIGGHFDNNNNSHKW